MEKEIMISAKTVIIQTVLRPMIIAYAENENTWTVVSIADFPAFFDEMSKFDLTAVNKIIVTRGPGSYAGIRTGISYVLGLIDGGVVKKDSVFSITAFDLIKSVSNEKEVFIKGWPRIPSHTFSGSKGYYMARDGQISYIEYEQLHEFSGALYAEEIIKEGAANIQNSSLLLEGKTYELTARSTELTNHSLEPLYVNPVHITQSK